MTRDQFRRSLVPGALLTIKDDKPGTYLCTHPPTDYGPAEYVSKRVVLLVVSCVVTKTRGVDTTSCAVLSSQGRVLFINERHPHDCPTWSTALNVVT